MCIRKWKKSLSTGGGTDGTKISSDTLSYAESIVLAFGSEIKKDHPIQINLSLKIIQGNVSIGSSGQRLAIGAEGDGKSDIDIKYKVF